MCSVAVLAYMAAFVCKNHPNMPQFYIHAGIDISIDSLENSNLYAISIIGNSWMVIHNTSI